MLTDERIDIIYGSHSGDGGPTAMCEHFARAIEAEVRKEQAEKIAELEALSVTSILLDIVPGDGSGYEVYAKSVVDVESKLTDITVRLDDYECGITKHPSTVKRIAELEQQLAEARKDSERVDWLVKNPVDAIDLFGRVKGNHPEQLRWTRDDIDEAIKAKEQP